MSTPPAVDAPADVAGRGGRLWAWLGEVASGGALRRTPLRVKLVAAVLALMFVALVVTSSGGVLALRSYLLGEVDRELVETVRRVPQFVPDDSPRGLPSNYVLAFVSRNGEAEQNEDGTTFYSTRLMSADELPQLPRNREEMLRRLGRPWTEQARSGPRRWRVLAVPQDRGENGRVTLLARDLTEVDRAVGRLVWIDVLVGGGILILLASVGAAVVRASLRPLVEIEQTAGAIAAGDLSRRVPDPEPGAVHPTSELGRLSRALNAMLAQIEAAFTARADSERAARLAESGARAAEAVARGSEARALRSEDKMRQFVADASHELRTPLTTIRGFAELYRQAAGADAVEGARLVRRIEDEAARMGLLVEDLLLLARLDRQRPLSQAPVTLAVLAGDAVQAARVTAPDRRIALDLAPGSAGLTVRGDDARLRQVLGNLLTNALVHTPRTAEVTVRLRAGDDGTAVLEVADSGPGLAPDQAERVFERFYRADAARSRHAGEVTGTGLGLAIVAAIVAAHAGTVEVESTPGVGATFRVLLPRLADDAE